jgi:hypothetical protein
MDKPTSADLYSKEQVLNTVLGEHRQYFEMLRRARTWFFKNVAEIDLKDAETWPTPEEFYQFLENDYGVRVHLVDGNIVNGYTVANELKHTKFLLTFC